MPTQLTMPALSPTMEHGTLAKWLVKEGDQVAPGDLIAEIETDKATMEYEAIDEGTIAKLLVAEGTEEVAVGTPIAILAAEGEEVSDTDLPPPSGEGDQPQVGGGGSVPPRHGEGDRAQRGGGGSPPDDLAEDEDPANAPAKTRAAAPPPGDKLPPAGPAPQKNGERLNVTPLARRIAEAKGLDLASLKGSGPQGRIVKADVEGAQPSAAKPAPIIPSEVQGRAAPAPAPAPGSTEAAADAPHEVIKLSNIRKITARRLTESKQTVPHYYLTIDARLDALLKLRGELNRGLEARGVKLSVNDFLVKALALALVEIPGANVQFAGDNLIKYARADISVAVAIEGGLITPIIRDAAEKRLSTIATEMKDLAARAREGKLKPHEFQGGTASLSNLGMYGIKQFDAVINPPQGMILAVGAGEKRPYVVDDALAIATVMSATGSFDHRAIDGATGAELMAAFKRLVESPTGMLA